MKNQKLKYQIENITNVKISSTEKIIKKNINMKKSPCKTENITKKSKKIGPKISRKMINITQKISPK